MLSHQSRLDKDFQSHIATIAFLVNVSWKYHRVRSVSVFLLHVKYKPNGWASSKPKLPYHLVQVLKYFSYSGRIIPTGNISWNGSSSVAWYVGNRAWLGLGKLGGVHLRVSRGKDCKKGLSGIRGQSLCNTRRSECLSRGILSGNITMGWWMRDGGWAWPPIWCWQARWSLGSAILVYSCFRCKPPHIIYTIWSKDEWHIEFLELGAMFWGYRQPRKLLEGRVGFGGSPQVGQSSSNQFTRKLSQISRICPRTHCNSDTILT